MWLWYVASVACAIMRDVLLRPRASSESFRLRSGRGGGGRLICGFAMGDFARPSSSPGPFCIICVCLLAFPHLCTLVCTSVSSQDGGVLPGYVSPPDCVREFPFCVRVFFCVQFPPVCGFPGLANLDDPGDPAFCVCFPLVCGFSSCLRFLAQASELWVRPLWLCAARSSWSTLLLDCLFSMAWRSVCFLAVL